MKRSIILALALALSWLPLTATLAADVNDFDIESFDGEYRLTRDGRGVGQLAVKETIVAVFPSIDQNHGLLRAIPQTDDDRPLQPMVQAVTDGEGRPYQYVATSQNDNLILRIGDADTYVHGPTKYVIEYQLTNVISFYDEHDEFFWDINGDQWSQPFGRVTAIIHLDDDLALSLWEQKRCLTGVYGATASNCKIETTVTDQGVDVSVVTEQLTAGENLSVVLGFNDGTFYQDPWPARQQSLKLALAAAVPLGVLWYAFSRWRKYGRDEAGRGVIVPQYAPPDDLNPLSADVVLNERLSRPAVSAALLELAISGYIRIFETQKKKLIGSDSQYELELARSPEDLPTSLKDVTDGLFAGQPEAGQRVKLAEQKNKLYSTMQTLCRDVPKGLTKRRYFAVDPNKARQGWVLRGVIILLIGFGLLFFSWTRWLGAGTMVGGLILIAFSPAMPARTRKGSRAKEELLGLKDYIQLAEADRLKFLQSPEGVRQYGDPTQPASQLKLFEKLLPYAMLFGLEKDWAGQFKHLYDQPPEWFSTNRSNFTPVVLADSLSGFNDSANTAFSAPSSSGSSGFSGGGFSGGGGGGGGGGGW